MTVTASVLVSVYMCTTCGRAAWPRRQLFPRPAGRRWPRACLWCHRSWSGSWGATPGDPGRLQAGRACTESPWEQDRHNENRAGPEDNSAWWVAFKGPGWDKLKDCADPLLEADSKWVCQDLGLKGSHVRDEAMPALTWLKSKYNKSHALSLEAASLH